MPEPFIHVTGLQKTYAMGREKVHALAGVDLALDANTFAAIVGPSGSGKSTLMYLLGGLDRPTSGSITVGGQVLEDLDENALAQYRRRTVGFVFQSFNLIPSMTALENVVFPLRFRRLPQKQRRERGLQLLQQVGLGDRAYHRPTELSGGQQQRVAIARALVNNPDLILADEPTGNLDTQSGLAIMQVLADLHRQGRAVLVVTHDPRMGRFATQSVHLLDGRIVDGKMSAAAMESNAA